MRHIEWDNWGPCTKRKNAWDKLLEIGPETSPDDSEAARAEAQRSHALAPCGLTWAPAKVGVDQSDDHADGTACSMSLPAYVEMAKHALHGIKSDLAWPIEVSHRSEGWPAKEWKICDSFSMTSYSGRQY